jgi:hypothetical protein
MRERLRSLKTWQKLLLFPVIIISHCVMVALAIPVMLLAIFWDATYGDDFATKINDFLL